VRLTEAAVDTVLNALLEELHTANSERTLDGRYGEQSFSQPGHSNRKSELLGEVLERLADISKKHPVDACEPLLQPSPRRNLFPLDYPDVYTMGQQQIACFWTVGEVDLSQDREQWSKKLTEPERNFISRVLAFFSVSDGLVGANLMKRFIDDVEIEEVRSFYQVQGAMESIHAQMYNQLIETLVQDTEQRQKLFNSVDHFPEILRKAEWIRQWTTDTVSSYALRLVAFAIVEGVFFSGSFASVFWLKKRGLMPGLAFSNELISRDEGMHCNFAVLLFGKLNAKPSTHAVHAVMREAVAIEVAFFSEALPVNLIGMNCDDMTQYICFVADRLLRDLGYPEVYTVANPFPFMDLISMEGKSNFFEKRVGEYQKAGVLNATGTSTRSPFDSVMDDF